MIYERRKKRLLKRTIAGYFLIHDLVPRELYQVILQTDRGISRTNQINEPIKIIVPYLL